MTNTVNKPPLYTDRRNSNEEHDKYVFISYSHCDCEYVYSDLLELYDRGLNYWYDDNLECGDEWNKVAISRIKNSNCIGIIFYMSSDMLSSEACMKEVKAFEERRNQNPDFIFKLISINAKSTLEHIRTFFLKNATLSMKELANAFPQDRLQYALSIFKDNILFLGKENPSDMSHIDKLVEELETYPVFSNDESKLTQLVNNGVLTPVGDIYTMEFGSYPQKLEEDECTPFSDGTFTISGEKYMAHDRVAFSFNPLKWNVIELNDNVLTLVSNKCIDASRGDEYDNWLNDEFIKLAFTDEERSQLCDKVTLFDSEKFKINQKNIMNSVCTDYFKTKVSGARMIVLWLDDYVPGTKKKMCVSLDNQIIAKGMPVTSVAGLRPVISIKIDL